jgi:hypothetical protein
VGLYAEDRRRLFGSVATYVYEWVAGGFFVVHTAYGCIGDSCVGGIEMIGYNPETGRFRTHFFDSRGNISSEDLTFPGWAASRSGKTGSVTRLPPATSTTTGSPTWPSAPPASPSPAARAR